MEAIQASALSRFSNAAFTSLKLELGVRFGHLLGRHVGLCRFAQALKAAVSEPQQLRKMAVGWEAIDFEAVKSELADVARVECTQLMARLCAIDRPGKAGVQLRRGRD